MMTLDVSLEEWIKKYTNLSFDLDDFCTCDKPNIKPFMAQKMVGIKCCNCNTATWIKRTNEQNKTIITLIY